MCACVCACIHGVCVWCVCVCECVYVWVKILEKVLLATKPNKNYLVERSHLIWELFFRVSIGKNHV